MLKEVPTDRFTVSKINVGGLPITFTKQDEIARNGLKFYQMEFKFVLKDEEIEGKQSGTIEIATDSRQFPQVKIPIVYEVAPVVWTIPSIVSFGTIKVGEKGESEVEFASRFDKPVEVTVKNTPSGIVFEKNDEDTYKVSFLPSHSGIWEEFLELELKLGEAISSLSLKCVAFVKE